MNVIAMLLLIPLAAILLGVGYGLCIRFGLDPLGVADV